VIAPENKGFAAGNNLGMKLSLRSPNVGYIWLLNNDTTVDKKALSTLISAHRDYGQNSDQNPGILGSRIKFHHAKNTIQAIGGTFNPRTGKVELIGFNKEDGEKYHQRGTYDMVLGASMFVDIEFIQKVGSLNEDYFLYFEELDWSIRGKKHGLLTRYEPDSIVYHKQGKSTGNDVLGKKSEFAMYHMYRSLLIFYQTYYPQYSFRIRLRIFIRLIKFQLKGQLNAWPVFKKIFLAT
jgi:GT2 family glycosyltransferase